MSYHHAGTVARLAGSWSGICRLIVFSIAAAAGAALAEGHPDHPRHPRPLKGQDVLCSECLTPNGGLLTAGFNDPLFSYAGRYMDSANTRNIQNVGMRTVRAQRIRVAGNRIFIEYGETIVAFGIPRFFERIGDVAEMRRVGALAKGETNRWPDPDEWLAKPETFFYPEAAASGWNLPAITSQDGQETIEDFDVDGNGHVYAGTKWWGWGIATDFVNNSRTARHMEFGCRVESPVIPKSVIALSVNGAPYAIVAESVVVDALAASQIVYGVGDIAAPVVRHTRFGRTHGIQHWARHDAGQRVAVVNADRKLRIYPYSSFVQVDPVPIALPELEGEKNFRQLSFDENGTLWAIEALDNLGSRNRLWRLTPGTSGYTVEHYDDVFGTFAPEKIAAHKNYLVIGGMRPGSQTELRLYRVRSTGVQFVDTGNFFFRYYHAKGLNDGYATGSTYEQAYTSLYALHLLDYDGKLYLLYSANGLGDVYEIKEQIPTTATCAVSPNPVPYGGTVTLTAKLEATVPDGFPPAGSMTFTLNGVAFATASLTASADSTYTATVSRDDLLPGTYTFAASFAGDDLYKPAASVPVVHEVQHVLPVIRAVAAGGGVQVTWTPVPGIQYDIRRTTAGSLLPPQLTRVNGGEYLDTDVSPGNFYRYEANAVYPNGLFGPLSLPDVASTFVFSDAGLQPGTRVKAAHVLELRTAVNALRQLAELPVQTFADIPASGVTVRAAHLTELQVAALPACGPLGIVFEPGVVPAAGVTSIGRVEMLALRKIIE